MTNPPYDNSTICAQRALRSTLTCVRLNHIRRSVPYAFDIIAQGYGKHLLVITAYVFCGESFTFAKQVPFAQFAVLSDRMRAFIYFKLHCNLALIKTYKY